MMKTLYLCCLLFIGASVSLGQNVDSLIDKLTTNKYELSYDIKDIPKSFIKCYDHEQRAYHIKSRSRNFTIVNPGESYNEFDFGTGRPGRRLVFGSKGIQDSLYFIYFQKGGNSVQNYLYIVQYNKNTIKNFIALSIDNNPKTYDSLKVVLLSKGYHVMD